MSKVSKRVQRAWQRFLVNRDSIRRDLLLGLTHLGSIPGTLFPVGQEPTVRSELDPSSYNSYAEYLLAVWQAVVPAERDSASPGTVTVRPAHTAKEKHSSEWFFLNGIGTAPPVALLEAEEIARIFERPVHLLHTPTWSVLGDVASSITARTLRKDGKLSRPALYVIQEALERSERVVLVCHSQGTIVASYIVRKLLRNPETRHLVSKLELYCVGGIADSLEVSVELSEEAGHTVPYVEHFANGKDFFAQVGILAHLDSTAGTVFCIPAKSGHLLNQHYLAGIARGDYCDRSSRLYKYGRGREPGDQDYIKTSAHDQVTLA